MKLRHSAAGTGSKAFESGEFRQERSRPAFDKLLQHGSQLDFSFSRASLSALEFNPAFVEAIEHLNAGCGVLHALRLEQRLPSLAWHGVCSHRTTKQVSEGGCDLLRGHTVRPFQLDHTAAAPVGLDQFGRHTSDVGRGNHRYRL